MTTYMVRTKHNTMMSFETHIENHKVMMDTSIDNGGGNLGPSPKKLLLGTLATCTGMDVVSLLNKMRVDFSDFEIITKASLTEDHPKMFSLIELIYKIKVELNNKDKVVKAVDLSKDKYCGISAMLAKNSPIDFKIEFI